MTEPRVVLRADAGPQIGIGHVMRSITLGETLSMLGAQVTLLSVELPRTLSEQASRLGVVAAAIGHPDDDEAVAALHPDVVIVDGYHLGPLLPKLARRGIRFGVIDDNHELPIVGASFVVNQNPHATNASYPDAANDQSVLTGTRYAMLRSDVIRIERGPIREYGNRVLVAMGGADPLGLSGRLVAALLRFDPLEVCVAIGATNPRSFELRALATQNADRLHVAQPDLVDGLRWADIAVIGAGTTMWETAYLGIPTIGLIVAQNQVAATRIVSDAGFVEVVDARDGVPPTAEVGRRCVALAADPERRSEMAARGRGLIDGRGAQRVAAAIMSSIKAAEDRPCRPGCCAGDPETS